jgi:signal transduction histidine kinase
MPGMLEETKEGALRVKKIVSYLRNFTRPQDVQLKKINLNTCIESALNIVWNELKYNCEVIKDYGDLPDIMGREQEIVQVFINLLVNAAQAIEEKGVITIRTYKKDGKVFAEVEDTGKGMTEDVLRRIFDPFFTTKEVGKGTGLGLSIVHRIMQDHNGDIHVYSTPGKGTEFIIEFPVVEEGGKR